MTRHPRTRRGFDRRAQVLVHIQIEAPRHSDLDVGTEGGPLTVLSTKSDDGDIELRLAPAFDRLERAGHGFSIRAEDGSVRLAKS